MAGRAVETLLIDEGGLFAMPARSAERGRAPERSSTDPLALAVAALSGVVLVVLPVILSRFKLGSPGDLWYSVSYPAMILIGFVVGWWRNGARGPFASTMLAASYLMMLALIPGAGEFLPFDIVIMLVLTMPVALATKCGSRLAARAR